MRQKEGKECFESLIAKAKKISNLLNYQKDAIVSRTIIDKKTGTVTLFAFDKEQGLSEHTAPFDALVHIIAGEAEIIISRKPRPLAGAEVEGEALYPAKGRGKPFYLKKDEMIIMPANEPHALRAIKRFKMLLTMIKT